MWNRSRSASIRIVAEVHDAITKMPGSFRQSIAAVRLLREEGLVVTMANVLMVQNSNDYQGVKALATELDARFFMDPTITPMMDGDRSILSLNVDEAVLQGVFRDGALVGNVEEFCAPPLRRRRGGAQYAALQCGAHRLLRLSVRRCLSVRPVSVAQRQCAADKVCGYLARFAATEGSPVHYAAGYAIVFPVLARRNVLALPGAGLHGRKHARTLFAGLRKILRTNRHSQREL